ncbi:alpha/beta hydrolase [Flavobacterium sp. CYK-4]|uniref:alpha/beta fold hydrolase n=1 Tax=Flavobacterium lotistagni TaxID=2709660 RepID=UPI00140891DB|nr:alpha/beta hydrolase [Flavobacterium lotistagni]NHM07700.1 alpha/beta hydrolase [Flavobacterium lotistagni]
MKLTPDFPIDKIAFVCYEIDAEKPTIIFLHDSLGCIELWREFPKQLGEAANCNVLLYDRQGYGKSCGFTSEKRDNDYVEHEADILNALLQHWNIEQAILFGHSDGGSIALIAAAKYPENIIGIITEGAHIFVEELTLDGIKAAMMEYETTDLKTRLSKYHGDKTDTMFRAWTETWIKESFRSWNIEHFLPKIQCPALIIQGEMDQFGTLAQVDGIISQSPKAQSLIIPGIGHTPHKENPEIVLEETAKFILNLQQA